MKKSEYKMNMQKMKRIILYLLVLAPAGLRAQQEKAFTLMGECKDSVVNGRYIYLVYVKDGKSQVDSALITDDKYVFKGEITYLEPAMLYSVRPMTAAAMISKNRVGIYLEPVSFRVIHVGSFTNVQTSGSVANVEYSKLIKQLNPLNAQMQTLNAGYREAKSAGDTAKARQVEQELHGIDSSIKEELMVYAKDNPSSPIALGALKSSVSRNFDPGVVGPIFDHLSEPTRNSEEGLAFQKTIEAARRTSIGQMAPDFTQNDTLGKPVSLSSFRGGYVLLDFWASWCGPCRMENPNVVTAFNKYKDKGFRVLSVSLDKPDAKDKWLEAIHKDGLTWQHVSDLQFWNNAVAKIYGINSIPQNFLIDPQGKIVGKSLRGGELEKKLEEIYKN
jgi:peroxiredoxin